MKFIALMLFLFSYTSLMAQDSSEIDELSSSSVFAESVSFYKQGKYADTIHSINKILSKSTDTSKSFRGLAAYWKGICYSRTKDFQNGLLR